MKVFFWFTILVVMSGCNSSGGKDQPAKKTNPNIDGEALHTMYCASCHKCDKDFTGPSLKGAASRWKDKALMYEFVRNPFGVIQKDSYAAGLLKKYNTIMTPSTLTNEQIDAVLDYCK